MSTATVPLQALVTVDVQLPVAQKPQEELSRAVEVAKLSGKALDRARAGKGDRFDDTLLARAANKLESIMPSYNPIVNYATYGLGAGGFGGFLIAATFQSVPVWIGTAAACASVPVLNTVLGKVAAFKRKFASDNLIEAKAAKPLLAIADTGVSTDLVLATNEAREWLRKGSNERVLSPEIRHTLEDLVERRKDLDPKIISRTQQMADLANLVTQSEPVTPDTVRKISVVLDRFDEAERGDIARQVVGIVSQRRGEAITYEGKHALADLARAKKEAAR